MWLWHIERGYIGIQGNGNMVMGHIEGGREGTWMVELSYGTHGTGQWGEQGSGTEVMVH